MGYAMPTQIGKGIHLRQYSRAFVIADAAKKSRVVFVSIDACMGTQIMKMQVILLITGRTPVRVVMVLLFRWSRGSRPSMAMTRTLMRMFLLVVFILTQDQLVTSSMSSLR